MAFIKLCLLCILMTVATITSGNPSPILKQQNNNAQFVHEKEEPKLENQHDEQEQYHLTNDFKSEQPQHPFASWNPYQNENMAAGHYFGLFGYPNPLFIPYPVFIPPEAVYPFQGPENYDDAMSRANTRRPTSYRNSPIYYVRLPPSPYMFIPGLGYTSQPPTFSPSFSPIMPIPALPVQSAINPFLNLPLNFMSNGKPSNVYQLDAESMPSQQYQPYVPPRPYRPSFQLDAESMPSQQYQPYVPSRPYRPSFAPPPNYISPDSKVTNLKRPFLFNGRPEDIYLLQGGFNPMYQSHIPGYY